MGKTLKHKQLLSLEPKKAELLEKLAADTRLAKQTLLREAVDDLLVKYEVLEVPKREP